MLRKLALTVLATGALTAGTVGTAVHADAAQPVPGHVYKTTSKSTPGSVTVRARQDGKIVATLAGTDCGQRTRSAIYPVRRDGTFRIVESFAFTRIVIKGTFTSRHRISGSYQVVVAPSPGSEGCRSGVQSFVARD